MRRKQNKINIKNHKEHYLKSHMIHHTNDTSILDFKCPFCGSDLTLDEEIFEKNDIKLRGYIRCLKCNATAFYLHDDPLKKWNIITKLVNIDETDVFLEDLKRIKDFPSTPKQQYNLMTIAFLIGYRLARGSLLSWTVLGRDGLLHHFKQIDPYEWHTSKKHIKSVLKQQLK